MTNSNDQTAETMNELRRKFEGVQWNVLALGAYIAHNIEPDELRDVDSTTNKQTTDHLRDIVLAEFGVNRQKVSAMNAELVKSIGAGGVDVVRWSKDDYLQWVVGAHLLSVDYSLLLRLLFDFENENTDSQTRLDE